MKKIATILLLISALAAASLSFSACTDGDEDETDHNVIVGDPEDDDTPEEPNGETVGDEWELGGVPLG